MFTVLGILIVLSALVMLIIYPSLQKEDKYTDKPDRNGQVRRVKSKSAAPAILLLFNKQLTMIIIAVGLFIALIPSIFFYAQPGVLYAVQYPWGGEKAVVSQGISTKWLGKTIAIQMEIPIKDVLPDSEDIEQSKYAYILKAKPREFNDAVKGIVANSIVIEVDYIAIDENGDLKFLDVAKKNRSQENLVFSRIVPFRDAVLKNTAKLMSAQEFISGASSEFDRAYKDQLENGMYVLEEVNANGTADTIGVNRVRLVGGNSDDTQKRVYKMKYLNGEPMRNEGALSDYGLRVVAAVVDKVDWEDKFDVRLDNLKGIVAETQTQKITAEKEMYRKQAVIEKGEADKAEEQAKLEKMQISETIKAETAVKKEKLFLEAAAIKYDKAVIEKKTRITLADAKRYELERADGLSEKEKYVIDAKQQMNKDQWEQVGKIGLPNYYAPSFGGTNSSSGSDGLSTLMQAAFSKQLLDTKK